MKVLLGAVLIDALHAALEHAVEAFHRVGVDLTTAVLACAVANVFVAGEMVGKMSVLPGFVRHDRRLLGDVGADDGHEMGGRGAIDVEGPGGAAALDQRQQGVLVSVPAANGHVAFLSNERLVDFHDLALAAERHELANPHSLAQPVRHEPSRLVGDAQHAVDLVAAHALLAGAEKMSGLEPEVQLNVAGLEYGADRDRKLLLAGAAAAQTDPAALDRRNPLHALAVRADRAFRPD